MPGESNPTFVPWPAQNNSLTAAIGEVECGVFNDSRRSQTEFEADARRVAAQGSLFGDGRLKILINEDLQPIAEHGGGFFVFPRAVRQRATL